MKDRGITVLPDEMFLGDEGDSHYVLTEGDSLIILKDRRSYRKRNSDDFTFTDKEDMGGFLHLTDEQEDSFIATELGEPIVLMECPGLEGRGATSITFTKRVL